MRSTTHTSIDMLHYEAKRRPDLMELISNVHNMSYEDIDNCKVKMSWMRKALRQLKDKAMSDIVYASMAERIAGSVIDGFVADPIGIVRRWVGGECFFTTGRGSSVLIPDNRILFFPVSGGLWFNTTFFNSIDQRFFTSTIAVGRSSKSEYSERYQEELQGNYKGDNLPQIRQVAAKGSSNSLAQYGVRFS